MCRYKEDCQSPQWIFALQFSKKFFCKIINPRAKNQLKQTIIIKKGEEFYAGERNMSTEITLPGKREKKIRSCNYGKILARRLCFLLPITPNTKLKISIL